LKQNDRPSRIIGELCGMVAEVISIGEELLIGQTVNTNAAWLAKRLNSIGISVRQVTAITDNQEEILRALAEASNRASLIITTGGLGPTRDDITKAALCHYFHTRLVLNESVVEDNKAFFASRGLPLTELNRLQAMVPEIAQIIRNPFGTAPGLWFEQQQKQFISLPGVPHEMKHMTDTHVLPVLEKSVPDSIIIHKTIMTQGIGESFLAELISEWEEALPEGVQLAYLPSPGIVKLRLSGRGQEEAYVKKQVEDVAAQLTQLIPQYIYGQDDQKPEEVAGKLLLNGQHTLATAESCTGGYLAHKITSIPGSSAYFKGSVVAYSNEAKKELLGIGQDLLNQHGAVSQQTVEAMAIATRKVFHAGYAIAISGIAGPGGGTEEKPVGTVWVAVASRKGMVSKKHLFGDNRERNIIRASHAALGMLINKLKDEL
jgi:nicotinamide-nucleotide amidase